MKVLLIDDEPFVIWIEEFLKDNNREVIWSRDVGSARTHIAHGVFECTVVDIFMPAPIGSPDPDEDAKIMGLILCREIQATKWGRGNIVVYSWVSETQFRELAIRQKLKDTKIPFFSKREREDAARLREYLRQKLKFGEKR